MEEDERRLEIIQAKRLLYSQIRELLDEKNRIELEVSTLKAEYGALDRELAEMNITICQPCTGTSKPKKPITLNMSQVQALADKLGIKLENQGD